MSHLANHGVSAAFFSDGLTDQPQVGFNIAEIAKVGSDDEWRFGLGQQSFQVNFCVARREYQIWPQRNDLFGITVNEDIDSARRISHITCRRILRKFRDSGDSFFVHQRAQNFVIARR